MSGNLASKPAANPGQFTRINSNPLLISAQKQMHLVEEAKKKKKEEQRKQISVGDDTPDWQSVSDKTFVKHHHFEVNDISSIFSLLAANSVGDERRIFS